MSAVLSPSQPEAAQRTHFSVDLRVDESINRDLIEGKGLVATAEACLVDCHDMAMVAKGNLDSTTAFVATLKERKKRFVAPAKQIVAEAEALFDPAIEAGEQAITIYRQQLGAWQMAEQRRIEDLRKKQQAEERARREQAERDAAAARARAEAAAAEERRKATEAAERERKAREEGNARAAAAAAAERAKAEEAERQKREQGERAAERITMTAAASAPAAPVQEVQKVAGLGLRDNWGAEVDPKHEGNESIARLEICKAIVTGGRTDLLAYLDINWKAANKGAGAQKELFNVPGLKAVNRPGTVNRKK